MWIVPTERKEWKKQFIPLGDTSSNLTKHRSNSYWSLHACVDNAATFLSQEKESRARANTFPIGELHGWPEHRDCCVEMVESIWAMAPGLAWLAAVERRSQWAHSLSLGPIWIINAGLVAHVGWSGHGRRRRQLVDYGQSTPRTRAMLVVPRSRWPEPGGRVRVLYNRDKSSKGLTLCSLNESTLWAFFSWLTTRNESIRSGKYSSLWRTLVQIEYSFVSMSHRLWWLQSWSAPSGVCYNHASILIEQLAQLASPIGYIKWVNVHACLQPANSAGQVSLGGGGGHSSTWYWFHAMTVHQLTCTVEGIQQ